LVLLSNFDFSQKHSFFEAWIGKFHKKMSCDTLVDPSLTNVLIGGHCREPFLSLRSVSQQEGRDLLLGGRHFILGGQNLYYSTVVF